MTDKEAATIIREYSSTRNHVIAKLNLTDHQLTVCGYSRPVVTETVREYQQALNIVIQAGLEAINNDLKTTKDSKKMTPNKQLKIIVFCKGYVKGSMQGIVVGLAVIAILFIIGVLP